MTEAKCKKDKISIGYCRVSSPKQKDDLERQEFVEDLVRIITVVVCRLQGKMANKARKRIKELTEKGGDMSDKVIQSPSEPQ